MGVTQGGCVTGWVCHSVGVSQGGRVTGRACHRGACHGAGVSRGGRVTGRACHGVGVSHGRLVHSGVGVGTVMFFNGWSRCGLVIGEAWLGVSRCGLLVMEVWSGVGRCGLGLGGVVWSSLGRFGLGLGGVVWGWWYGIWRVWSEWGLMLISGWGVWSEVRGVAWVWGRCGLC